jgi:hypothetical protein
MNHLELLTCPPAANRSSAPLGGFATLLLVLLTGFTTACAQTEPDPHIVAQAISAAPAEKADGAAVYGYAEDGTLELVREGTNDLVCMADNPQRDGFEASCYHESLLPYVARGVELRAGGMDGMSTVSKRAEEVEAGELEWPDHDAIMYIRFGEDAVYNPETMTVDHARLRYVIYTPYATAASTGLPEQAMAPGAPWLMSAGTFRAHIMIVPPGPDGDEGHH